MKRRERLGATGLALLPFEKLKLKSPRGIPFEQEIHENLIREYNGYTVASGNISGHWKDSAGQIYYGEHREYRIAIDTPDRRADFEEFLARLAAELEEQCIYAEIGAEIVLIYAQGADAQ